MAGAVRLPLGVTPVALGPDKVVGLRLEQADQGVLDRLPDQLAQVGPEALFIQCYDRFGYGRPPICLSSRQLESYRGEPCPPFYLDAILLSKCARYCTLTPRGRLAFSTPARMLAAAVGGDGPLAG